MNAQPDLFIPVAEAYVSDVSGQALAWEQRALSDLVSGPAVLCPDGFMGSVHERLVSKGLVSSEPAGDLAVGYPQRRYSRTDQRDHKERRIDPSQTLRRDQ